MKETLLSAIQDKKAWLSRFTRTEYERAFQEYRTRYEAPFRAAIREAEGDLSALARELLDELSSGWKRERFWNRTARKFDEKQMTLVYLSPMLEEIGEGEFARCLQKEWVRRWPKDGYQLTSWRKLNKSFRLTIMGFEVGQRREDED